MIAAMHTKREKHISVGGSPWLLFDSKEELEKARREAEVEAQKLLDDAQPKHKPKSKKKRSASEQRSFAVLCLLGARAADLESDQAVR